MFKLYSKIKYIFPLAAGDNWRVRSLREPSPSPSLQWTYYIMEAPMKDSVHNTSGNTESFWVYLKAVCLHLRSDVKWREKSNSLNSNDTAWNSLLLCIPVLCALEPSTSRGASRTDTCTGKGYHRRASHGDQLLVNGGPLAGALLAQQQWPKHLVAFHFVKWTQF